MLGALIGSLLAGVAFLWLHAARPRVLRPPGAVRGPADPHPGCPELPAGRPELVGIEHRGVTAEGFHIDTGEGTMVVTAIGRIPGDLVLSTRTQADLGEGVGDPAFDARVCVAGDRADLLALLDGDTRAVAERVIAGLGVHVRHGRVSFERVTPIADSAERESIAEALLELARRLDLTAIDPASRLWEAIQVDPAGRGSGERLRLLLDRYPDAGPCEEAAALAISHPEPATAISGARYLADERALRVLQTISSDAATECATRLLAVDALLGAFPLDAGLPPVARAMAEHRAPRFIRGAARRLAETGAAGAVAPIAAFLPSATPDLAIELCGALGQLGRPEAQPALVVALDGDSVPVRMAAARALGACAGPTAIEALRKARVGRLGNAELKRVVREAIEAIQDKNKGAVEGTLTLVEDPLEVGGLSVVEEAGAVSLAEPDREPLEAEEEA